MALNIRPTTSDERRLLFIETLINLSTKISKVSNNSVLSGIAGGVSKVAGKAEKDIILAVSQLFPDSASGDVLDQVAFNNGIAPRFGPIGSSTYVRLTATPGTVYAQSTQSFSTSDGQIFNLESDITIGSFGFNYAKVNSSGSGSTTNVAPGTISTVVPAPVGHINVVNEYQATGGIDNESDDIFRQRIKNGPNILARGTIAMLEQLFMLINNKVLSVQHNGINQSGQVVLSISTQNGENLTSDELAQLLQLSTPFFGLTDYKPYGTNYYGIILENVTYHPFDISFRCDLDSSFNSDQIRNAIQVNISKYINFRYFNPLQDVIQWTNLLDIVKFTPGVNYVYDQFFYPNIDLNIDYDKLPRLRGFLMLDRSGNVISNESGSLSPIYYPAVADFSYQSSILGSL